MAYEIPYHLVCECIDVNHLEKMVMKNNLTHNGNRGIVFPLHEVMGRVINEFDRGELIENLVDILLDNDKGVEAIYQKIRRILEEEVAEYLNEEIHCEASLKSREAVDALYHAYEPA